MNLMKRLEKRKISEYRLAVLQIRIRYMKMCWHPHLEIRASKLPDMFVSYPKIQFCMLDDTELVDYYDYFTEEELNEFIPAFLEEGVIHERLSILPVAKSTEVMFINKTAFDRFAKETGAKMEDLKTWEGKVQYVTEPRTR